jgi:NTP pyrophosphatase (non-canonical NTP hydrolase)
METRIKETDVRGLDLNVLREANLQRLPLFKNKLGQPAHSQPDGSDWSLAEWGNAVGGEVGELQNLCKKVLRGDVTLEEARADIGREIADVLTYLDILAFRAGLNLGTVTIDKWNEVSERVGVDIRLSTNTIYHQTRV